MKPSYDFSKGKRGRIAPPEPEPPGKTRITIRLDEDLVAVSYTHLDVYKRQTTCSRPARRPNGSLPRSS